MKKAYVFPGQGGQFVGMGAGLYADNAAARDVFDQVDEALGQKLSTLMFEGSAEELNMPANVQPAIYAVSVATLIANVNNQIPIGAGPDYVLGHSLGEYAALDCIGTNKIGPTARLLRRRGELMQAAAASGGGDGAMAAIIGDVDVASACADAVADVGGVAELANDNGANQWVISGTGPAVQKAMEIAKSRGAKLVKKLAVSVPAHSSLMQSAVSGFAAALDEFDYQMKPRGSRMAEFVSNKTAAVMDDAAEIKDSLVYQLTNGVRWRESVLFLKSAGVEEIIEIGPGNVLTGLCKRILPEANCWKLE